jgi:predicted ATPase
VRLFAARASAAAPGFTLDADTARAVAVLCRRLDGIPLALELAASRVRALGVHELVTRMDDRFRLLATGLRDAPARQQTLSAMIGWSWDLLTGPERAVLRRLPVHADGCTLEAAEKVCAGGEASAADVAGLLSRLVDHSLVTVTHSADGPRYQLLESLAAYCAGRLAEADGADRAGS